MPRKDLLHRTTIKHILRMRVYSKFLNDAKQLKLHKLQ